MLVFTAVRVAGEWFPLQVGGTINLEFDAVFRGTSVWGAVSNVPPPVIKRRSKNEPKKISPGVLVSVYGGGVI